MTVFGKNSASPPAKTPCGGGTSPSEDPQKHWIEIEMRYEDNGDPVQGEEYLIKLPDNTERRGTLDDNGFAREANVEDPGSCVITFPKLDSRVWSPG
jgi:hypothetical protein